MEDKKLKQLIKKLMKEVQTEINDKKISEKIKKEERESIKKRKKEYDSFNMVHELENYFNLYWLDEKTDEDDNYKLLLEFNPKEAELYKKKINELLEFKNKFLNI